VYGGVSAETRQAERRGRLMQAGLALISTEGWGSTTVRGVCRAAGLSSRFFYESFADLDELAVAIFDDITDSTLSAAFAEVQGAASDEELVRATVEVLVREYTQDSHRARFVFVEALGSEPLMRRRLAVMRRVAELIVERMQGDQESDDQGDYLEVVAAVLSGGFVELMICYLTDELQLSPQQLIDNFTALCLNTWAIAVSS